jgi:hypothetical protein
MDTAAAPSPSRSSAGANPALWAMIGIPAATVVASIITLAMAFGGAEPELPERYAWEGAALDQDLARATRARELGLGAELGFVEGGRVVLRLDGAAVPDYTAPQSLTLHLTHATRPESDRSVTLTRSAVGDRYEGLIGSSLPDARWLIQLDDARGEWRLRGRLETPGAVARLGY